MCFVPTFGGTNRAVSARFGLHELLKPDFFFLGGILFIYPLCPLSGHRLGIEGARSSTSSPCLRGLIASEIPCVEEKKKKVPRVEALLS